MVAKIAIGEWDDWNMTSWFAGTWGIHEGYIIGRLVMFWIEHDRNMRPGSTPKHESTKHESCYIYRRWVMFHLQNTSHVSFPIGWLQMFVCVCLSWQRSTILHVLLTKLPVLTLKTDMGCKRAYSHPHINVSCENWFQWRRNEIKLSVWIVTGATVLSKSCSY